MALTEVAQRSGWTVVQTFSDEGISGAKGRDKRPGYDALLKAVARREVDIVAALVSGPSGTLPRRSGGLPW